jgi:hypothetical protein
VTAHVSLAVVGHIDRLIPATELAANLGAVLALDHGSTGAVHNHLLAWELTTATPAAWSAVLEDDAAPVEGFAVQIEAALQNAPGPVVSLYLGRARPKLGQAAIPTALARADNAGAHWLTDHRMRHAVAVAMRAELLDDWLTAAPDIDLPIDERLGEWCRQRGYRVAYCLPSLVDHHDWPTLIAHRDRKPRTEARKAWRVGTREHWNARAVRLD